MAKIKKHLNEFPFWNLENIFQSEFSSPKKNKKKTTALKPFESILNC